MRSSEVWLRIVGVSLVVSGLTGASAQAQVPQLIRYQGTLVDTNNVPLEGSYSLTFRIYDAATAGSPLWTETQAAVPVSRGVFNVLLGQVSPLTLAFDKDYWLTTQVGTDAEMTPRQRLTSVPYAYRAKVAEQLTTGSADSVRVTNSASLSVPSNTQTVLSFDTEVWDPANLHDPANPSRLTAQTAGTYLVIAQAEFDNWPGSDCYGEMLIKVNGSMHGWSDITWKFDRTYVSKSVSTLLKLNAGDYVEVAVYHNAGAPLTLWNDGYFSPHFMMLKVPGA